MNQIPPEILPTTYKKNIERFYGDESTDLHLLIGKPQPEDVQTAVELFFRDQFSQTYDGEMISMDANSMADIFVLAGIFPSITQARKNGKDTPILHGYSEHKLGKKKRRVFIYNIGGSNA